MSEDRFHGEAFDLAPRSGSRGIAVASRDQRRRHDQCRRADDGRARVDVAFECELGEPALQPFLERARPGPRIVARKPRVPAGTLLQLELVGAVVPVGDLGGEPRLHLPLHLVDLGEPAAADLVQMARAGFHGAAASP